MTLETKISTRSARVAVIGLGYVGLPLAVTIAKAGFPVVGFDVDAGKAERLSAGSSYIDAVSDDDLSLVQGNFDWTTCTKFERLSEVDVIIICVPTPLTREREPDLSYVEETAGTIAKHMTSDTLVALESTTWPGTTCEVMTPILETSGLKNGKDFFSGFSPEREDPGNSTYRTKTIPKIVAGDGERAGNLMESFYDSVVETVVRVPDTATAEAVKITENIFRSVNIALVNELKLIYEPMGIDVWEVIKGAATKPFGYMPFYPGPGLGGHCIPIDPFYLTWRARKFDVPTRFIELAGEINTSMPRYVVDRLRETLDRATGRGLNGAKILLVGVAYKKNVSDMRESPSMRLMQLMEEARAHVEYLDPHVPELPVMRQYGQFRARRAIAPEAVARAGFDVVLIATDHDAIDYAALLELGCPVVDTRDAIASRNLTMDRVTKA